jgi:hypothetical protein
LPKDFGRHYPIDATIHTEPVQVIHTPPGGIVFIDVDGIGRGSKYQDLGFVKYRCDLYQPEGTWAKFIEGYGHPTLHNGRLERMAGVVALAYARFYDKVKRVRYGLRQLERG